MDKAQPSWMRLDNAAKIYPSARRRNWSAMFRLSMSLYEQVVPEILQTALDSVIGRFPSLAVRLRRGFFWYYLEGIEKAPSVKPDAPYPCVRMSKNETRTCAFRVLYYKDRIAVEFFHALTDGSGAMVFLKTLTAEYLRLRHKVRIPFSEGVVDIREAPSDSELEDSFLKNEGEVRGGRREKRAFNMRGCREPEGFLNITTGVIPLSEIAAESKKHSVSLTAFLVSAMISVLVRIQNSELRVRRLQKPVTVMVPVNLRPYFSSNTLRNFSLYITPGIDPRMGDYSFEEILKDVHHQMGTALSEKQLKARLTANVRSEKNVLIKILPLFMKNVALRTAYNIYGERGSSMTISNLGLVKLPEEMMPYVRRIDFVLGALAQTPCNCGVLSYGGKLYINIIRSIREPTLEHAFFTCLRKMGMSVFIESNQQL